MKNLLKFKDLDLKLDILTLQHSFTLQCIYLEDKTLLQLVNIWKNTIWMIYGLLICKKLPNYNGKKLKLKVNLLHLDMVILVMLYKIILSYLEEIQPVKCKMMFGYLISKEAHLVG